MSEVWSKPPRMKSVVALSIDEVRAMWLTAFATATVMIEMGLWSPQNTKPDDMEERKRLKAEEMADKVVENYRQLQKE